MKTGIILAADVLGTDPAGIRDFAQSAEAMGYSHLLGPEHVLLHDADHHKVELELGLTYESPFHEPFTLFSFIAGVTQTIELITGVLVLPQRQTALVAKQAAEVDLLSNRRFTLGIGVGWNSVEYEAIGADFHTRGRRIEEQVHLLRELWTEPLVDFSGEFERVDHLGINPRPERTIPIWMGGSADAVLDRIARIGDGWVVFNFGSRGELAEMLDRFREKVRAQGRDLADLAIHIGVFVTPENVERQAERLGSFEEMGVTHVGLIARAADPGLAPNLELLRRFAEVAELPRSA